MLVLLTVRDVLSLIILIMGDREGTDVLKDVSFFLFIFYYRGKIGNYRRVKDAPQVAEKAPSCMQASYSACLERYHSSDREGML